MSDATWIERVDHTGEVVELVLKHAPVNALSANNLFELRDCINALSQEDKVRAIVITSALKVFSAGINLKEAEAFSSQEQCAMVQGLNEGFLALFSCPKPVICAIEGAAIAGGLFFVLTADHRIASENAKFGLAEVRVGVDFPIGPFEIAKAMLSANAARRLMLRGQPVDAQSAQEMGLIDLIVAHENVRKQALVDAAEFAQIPPKAYAAIKMQLRRDVIERIRSAPVQKTDWFSTETRPAMLKMLGQSNA